MQADILDAVATLLNDEMDVPVYYPEIPRATIDAWGMQPENTLEISAGGSVFSAGDNSYVKVARMRADLRCYGPTHYQAMKVYREAAELLKEMRAQVVIVGAAGEEVGVKLDNAILSSGPLALTDPDTKWPFVVATWGVHGSEVEIAEFIS